MKTIYADFEKSIAQLPKNQHIALLIRHSIRHDIDKSNDFACNLTREGEQLAEFFGKSIDLEIKNIYASKAPRCTQTAKAILRGYNKEIEIKEDIILNGHWIKDFKAWSDYFNSYNQEIVPILTNILKKQDINGVYNPKESIYRLLEFLGFMGEQNIFTKDSQTLDIFITHDAIIMYFLAFALRSDIKQLYEKCVYMLEGIFFWKINSTLYFTWRGTTYPLNLRDIL